MKREIQGDRQEYSLDRTNDKLGQSLRRIQQSYRDIFLILSPPRCSSTAFARVFWEQPSVRCYLHEPFDLAYHRKSGPDEVLGAFDRPFEIRDSGDNLVIKEMTFQVGRYFPVLMELTSRPILFLIRDPRLSNWSRMEMLRQGGQDPIYPEKESGWVDLERQIVDCKANGVRYFIIDSSDFRNHPGSVFPRLFESLDLPFSREMLHWAPRQSLRLGSLGDEQNDWYRRVLSSTALQPAKAKPRSIDEFPRKFRQHLRECMSIYANISRDVRLISP